MAGGLAIIALYRAPRPRTLATLLAMIVWVAALTGPLLAVLLSRNATFETDVSFQALPVFSWIPTFAALKRIVARRMWDASETSV